MNWQKPSNCKADEPQCVEVYGLDAGCDYISVRNSRSPQRVVSFDTAEWEAFIKAVKAGEYNLP